MIGNASVVTAMPVSPTAWPRNTESTMLYSALNVIIMIAGMENSNSSFSTLLVPRRSVDNAVRSSSVRSSRSVSSSVMPRPSCALNATIYYRHMGGVVPRGPGIPDDYHISIAVQPGLRHGPFGLAGNSNPAPHLHFPKSVPGTDLGKCR